jgi:endoglucanase
MKTTLFTAIAGSTLVFAAPAQVTPRGQKVQYAGVNIAGFDFGCTIDGKCALTGTNKPYNIVSQGTALGQMSHFVKDDSLNAFRLPVGWQFLLNNQLGGTLDGNNAGQYDSLVQGCLNSGASLCILERRNCWPGWTNECAIGGCMEAACAEVRQSIQDRLRRHERTTCKFCFAFELFRY